MTQCLIIDFDFELSKKVFANIFIVYVIILRFMNFTSVSKVHIFYIKIPVQWSTVIFACYN